MAWLKSLLGSSRINIILRCPEGESVTSTLKFLRTNLSKFCLLGVQYFFQGFMGSLHLSMSLKGLFVLHFL